MRPLADGGLLLLPARSGDGSRGFAVEAAFLCAARFSTR